MLRKLVILVVAVVLAFSISNAAGLEKFFNPANHVFYNGTDIIIGNIKVGDSFYWLDWRLQNDLTFKLIKGGFVDNGTYVDLARLCESKGAVEVTRSEVESLGFSDLEGCERFTKKPNGMYCCDGGNFYKVLGKVINTGNGTEVIKYRGWIMPRYMMIGVPYTSQFSIKTPTEEGIMFATISFSKISANGKHCIKEVFYGLTEFPGKFYPFYSVYYFDPITYQPCFGSD